MAKTPPAVTPGREQEERVNHKTMPVSKQQWEFVSYVVDRMSSIGPVYAKGMFGGHGIYLDGLIFALIADGVLYLKSDEDMEKEFNLKGLEAFTFNKKGKEYRMSYYQAPEESLEDSEQLKLWANRAYRAALRAAEKKRRN